MTPNIEQHGFQSPPSGKKKKKKLSKSERKRRQRSREEAEATPTKEANANATVHANETQQPNVEVTPSSSPEPSDTPHKTSVVQDNGDNNNNSPAPAPAPAPAPIKLVNETSMTSRKVLFVYPKKDKNSTTTRRSSSSNNSSNKLVSYMHSKLRKAEKDANENHGESKDDDAKSDDKPSIEMMDDSIDDILYPARKKQRKEEAREEKAREEKAREEKEAAATAARVAKQKQQKEKKEAKKEKATPTKKNTEKEPKPTTTEEIRPISPMISISKASKTTTPMEECQDEKKDADQQEERPIRGRSRSDSLSDPMNSRLSGRTVEDAVKDKSGRRPRSNSTDGELNLPKRGLCDERMVIRNYKWDLDRFKRAPPRGFINLGNTCFLNSTLQCLTYLPTFCQCVAELPSNKDENENGQKKKIVGQQITVFLRNLLRRVHALDGEAKQAPLAPKAIVRSLSHLGGSHRGYKFRPGRQEDAHEFLVHLLDAMNDGELKAAGTYICWFMDCDGNKITRWRITSHNYIFTCSMYRNRSEEKWVARSTANTSPRRDYLNAPHVRRLSPITG